MTTFGLGLNLNITELITSGSSKGVSKLKGFQKPPGYPQVISPLQTVASKPQRNFYDLCPLTIIKLSSATGGETSVADPRFEEEGVTIIFRG